MSSAAFHFKRRFNTNPRNLFLPGIVAAIALSPAAATACTVCMGDLNSQAAGAINAAIFLMLGLIGFVLAGLGGFAFYLMRRANAPLPPGLDLDSATEEDEGAS